MDAIAQFVACLAVAALVIMQHRRFTEVEERLAAISRALEQSLAETQQVHKIRAISTHVSGRLGQIDAKLERFERELYICATLKCTSSQSPEGYR